MNQDDFIILNLNRNQPRKRWDHCIMAYVKFISKHIGEKIKLLVMTTIEGSWNIAELLKYEGLKYGLTVEQLKNHFIFIQNPQKLRDYDINIMYNAANIGFNTCDGEGFGLCNFEQAGVGVPQVVPEVGGFRDFFNENNSIMVKPVISIYGDTAKDAVGGEMELCSIDDYVSALERYYGDRDLIISHGKQARLDVVKYTWEDKAKKFHEAIIESTKDLYPDVKESSDIMNDINKILSINDKEKEALYMEEKESDKLDSKVEIDEVDDNDNDNDEDIDIDHLIEEKLKKNAKPLTPTPVSENQIKNISENELITLQKKIAKLLNK